MTIVEHEALVIAAVPAARAGVDGRVAEVDVVIVFEGVVVEPVALLV